MRQMRPRIGGNLCVARHDNAGDDLALVRPENQPDERAAALDSEPGCEDILRRGFLCSLPHLLALPRHGLPEAEEVCAQKLSVRKVTIQPSAPPKLRIDTSSPGGGGA